MLAVSLHQVCSVFAKVNLVVVFSYSNIALMTLVNLGCFDSSATVSHGVLDQVAES